METRIRCRFNEFRMDGQDGFAPQVEGPSYLRFTCKVTVQYAFRRLGGGGVAEAVHTEPARTTSESKHLVDDPSAFLDYDQTQQIARRLFTELPELSSLDLSPSNWYMFTPNVITTNILRVAHMNEDQGLCGGHYRFAVDMDIQVNLVFSEPKALLNYCNDNVMQTTTLDPAIACCGICLEDLTTGSSSVNLPCSHAFHSQCIAKWFFKGTACPLCRQELRGLVVAPWAIDFLRRM